MDTIELLAVLYEVSVAYIIGKSYGTQDASHKIQELNQSQQRQEQALSHITHSLQTPLAVLQSEIELLAAHTHDPDAFVASKYSVKRISEFVHQLLHSIRLDIGRQHYVLTPLNLSELVSEQVEYIEVMAQQYTVETTSVIEPGIVVQGNRHLLEELITTIAHNAIKYRCPDRPCTLHIMLHTLGLTVELSCTDNGIGIATEDIKHIFERFYRSTYAPQKSSGFGLGLAIVKKIVDIHGASIDVKSTQGEGTCVSVVFAQRGMSIHDSSRLGV